MKHFKRKRAAKPRFLRPEDIEVGMKLRMVRPDEIPELGVNYHAYAQDHAGQIGVVTREPRKSVLSKNYTVSVNFGSNERTNITHYYLCRYEKV